MSLAKDLKCPECPEMFWSNVSMNDHLRLVHAPVPVEKSLAQIAESLKPVGEFFNRLNKGEVYLISNGNNDFNVQVRPRLPEGGKQVSETLNKKLEKIHAGQKVRATFGRSDFHPEPIEGDVYLNAKGLWIDLNPSISFQIQKYGGEMGYLLTDIEVISPKVGE